MAWITQRRGIVISTLFSIVIILGAYLLGTGALNPNTADAISTTVLLQNIARKDSDHDGLPNWEEALYGTNPYKADTFGLGMTDGEAVAKGLIVPKASTIPNTIATSTENSATSYFSSTSKSNSLSAVLLKNLAANYLAQKKLNAGTKLTKEQITNIVQQTLGQISVQISNLPSYIKLSQIKVSGSGNLALRAYAREVQQAFSKNTITQDKGELIYLQEAMQGSDTAPLTHIRAISNLYKKAAVSLYKMTVPKEVLQAHFELINAYARMANVSYGLAKVNTDPITAMLALSEYKKAVLSLEKGFTDLGNAFQSSDVVLTPSDPGYSFVNVISDTTAK